MAQVIQIVGPKSPISAVVATVWGLKGPLTDPVFRKNEYGPVWQSKVLSAADIEEIVGTGPGVGSVEAFRLWIEHASGLGQLGSELAAKGEEAPVAFAIVLTIVGPKSLLRGAMPLGVGDFRGRETDLGALLAYLRPSYPLAPEMREKDSAHHLDLTALPQADLRNLVEFLALTGWDKTRHRPIAFLGDGTPWVPTNVLGRAAVTQTAEYKKAKVDVVKVQQALSKKAGREIDVDPYIFLLSQSVVPFGIVTGRGKKGDPDVWFSERWQQKIGRWSESRVVADERKSQQRGVYRTIFNFAASVCRQIGVAPHGARRADIAKSFLVKGKKTSLGEQVLAKMAEYGIELPDPNDPKSQLEALLKLKGVLKVEYKHTMAVVQPPSDDEFQREYLAEMARLNPGQRLRRPRRARRSRRNPLRPHEVDEAVRYAQSRREQPDAGELPQAFSRLVGERSPEEWEISQDRLGRLFPTMASPGGQGKGLWNAEARLRALEQENIVSRVGGLDPRSELVQRGRAAALDRAIPTEDPAALALAMAEAGLSLDEALYILDTQRQTKRAAQTREGTRVKTIPPSSAICKRYRKRRLGAYQLPPEALTAGDSTRSRVVIWMSPKEVYFPRVMTWRQGVHLDCDMTGKDPADLIGVLGKSILATLYWLVEKPQRLKATDVYVGRVGQSYLSLALKSGQAVSLGAVSSNLRKAAAGEAGYQVPLYDERERKARTERDVQAYVAAARSQIGADAARETETRPVVSASAPVYGPVPTIPAPRVPSFWEQAAEGDENDELG